jgi:hypothetical protein
MFCKVCYDSGKSSYNNHNVRDCAGNVICPVLLNTKCNNCSYFGHTSKYCKYKPINTSIQSSSSSTIKSVKFGKDVKSYSVAQKNTLHTNKFSLCDFVIDDEDNVSYELEFDFCINNIIWGVGQRDMVGISWADACGA